MIEGEAEFSITGSKGVYVVRLETIDGEFLYAEKLIILGH